MTTHDFRTVTEPPTDRISAAEHGTSGGAVALPDPPPGPRAPPSRGPYIGPSSGPFPWALFEP